MWQLWWTVFDLLIRRWIRSGHRSRHPAMFAIVGVGSAILASVGLAAWVRNQLAGVHVGSPPLVHLLTAVVFITLFSIAGSLFLLAESTRRSGAAIQSVLHCLPFSSREIPAYVDLPLFVMSAAVVILCWLPGFAALSALRMSAYASAVGSLLALLAALPLEVMTIVAVREALRRIDWLQVQYPLMVLAWMGVIFVEGWRMSSLAGSLALTPVDYFLMLPWLLRSMGSASVPPALPATVAVSAMLSIGLSFRSLRASGVSGYGNVLWTWSSRSVAPLVTLSLTQLCRSRHFTANLCAAGIVTAAVACAVLRLPPSVRPFLAGPLVALVVGLSAFPLLTIRGLTTARPPLPLALGYGPAAWAASQVTAGAGLAVAVVLPAIALFACSETSPVVIAMWGGPHLVASTGLGLAIGWSFPARADNPMGQLACATALLGILGVVGVVLDRSVAPPSLGLESFLVVAGSIGMAWPVALEAIRWHRTTAHA